MGQQRLIEAVGDSDGRTHGISFNWNGSGYQSFNFYTGTGMTNFMSVAAIPGHPAGNMTDTLRLYPNWNPTIASASSSSVITIKPTVNQTNGHSGITRGLHIDPTLTSATDWRAIESARGNVLLATVSGNVGIGTSAPTAKLDVVGAASFRAGFSTYTNDGIWNANATPNLFLTPGSSRLRLGYADNGSGIYYPALGFELADNSGFSATAPLIGFRRNNNGSLEANNRFQILSDGTIQWGPGGTTTLDVRLSRSAVGTLTANGNLSVTGAFTAQNYSATEGMITGGATGLLLGAGGTNQNITLAPGTTGETRIYNGSASPSIVRIGNGATGITATDGLELGVDAAGLGRIWARDDSLVFGVTSSERARLTAAGNLGIGATNPQARLEIGSGHILVNGTNASNQDLFIANAGGRKVEILTDAEGDGKLMLRDTSGTSTQVAITAGGSSYLNGGNVGIGTTTPAAKLDVAGELRVTGSGNTVVKGPLLIVPQGDLSMGEFTAGTNPSSL